MSNPTQEPCPKCSKVHTRGKYETNDATVQVRVMPHDVKCDCGLMLRWSVPIFKMTESGYVLRPLLDTEDAFVKGQ